MSLWAFAVQRWQFTLVVFLLLVALGSYALVSIPRQEDPAFPIPVTSVIVHFPGAEPVDVERLVVDPIEDVVAELDDVKEIRSTSEDGLAVIRIEFEWTVDAERKYDEVIREVNALRPSLPAEVADIVIRKSNPGLVNIVQLALVGESASALQLMKQSDALKERLQAIPGIRKAETWGWPEPQLQVALDLPRLAALGLDPQRVAAAISGAGRTVPGGTLDAGERRYNVKTSGDYRSPDELAATVVASSDGRLVILADVAEVSWGEAEHSYLARYNGERAAFVTASLKDGKDIFAVQRQIDAVVAEFRTSLPAGLRLEVGFVQASNVADRLQRLGIDFAIAIGLVSLTLLPLGLRAAGIVMLAIPLSLAMGIAGLWFLGFSLNQISIAGFVVALGLLVDDAIVVVENIARHLREGASRMQATIAGTSQIVLPVLGCTATLLFAFLPLLSLPEGAGLFTRGLPLAVVLTVVASLLVALTVVPFVASRVLPRQQAAHGNLLLRGLTRLIHLVYAPLVRHALRWPRTSLLLGLLLCAASVPIAGRIGFSLFPAADKPQFLITVRAPEGASLTATDEALRLVEQELARHPEVKHVLANLGKGNPYIYYNIFPLETKSTTAELLVSLERWDPLASPQLLERLRARFAQYPAAQIVVKQFENGPPIEAPLAVRIIGPELATLRRLAGEVEAVVAATPGTRDINNPVRLPRIDYQLGIDTIKAGLLGFDEQQVDELVRLAIAGNRVATYRDDDGDEFAISLRLPFAGNPTFDQLDQILLTSPLSGEPLPLAQLTDPKLVSGPNRIERLQRERMVTVTAYLQPGQVPSQVAGQIYRQLAELQLPPGYRIAAGGEAEAAAKSLGGLGTAIIVALCGILAVLVLEFGTFRSTLIVAGVIPFGIFGAIAALALTGYPLSYMAIIGFVALIGVEIKNSILLVDFTNQLRSQGAGLDEAIEKAGEMRFLPVLFTSVTAIGGLLPLALAQSALYSPLAVVMIGGLISSTLLARIITPVMYRLLPPAVTAASAA